MYEVIKQIDDSGKLNIDVEKALADFDDFNDFDDFDSGRDLNLEILDHSSENIKEE